jgi:integrase
MISKFIDKNILNIILAEMQPLNALALRISLKTGLRISDVLKIKTSDLERVHGFTMREQKTGKSKRIRLPVKLRRELREVAGSYYAFTARLKHDSHRTRQTVYRDMKRACRALKIAPEHISPHSMRKIYAVNSFERSANLADVQKKLNHDYANVTVIYALADKLV